ncbi:MAG: VanZ family protein [Planctomycetales bacterium]
MRRVLIVYWMGMFVATHIPKIPRRLQVPVSDKWQHYAAYALLGWLVACCWSWGRPVTWQHLLAWMTLLAAYGAIDEITQPLFGREADWLDWRADVVGAASGLAIFMLLSRWSSRKGPAVPTDR